jgi:hypothetical protein
MKGNSTTFAGRYAASSPRARCIRMNRIVANPEAIRAHVRTTLRPVMNPDALTIRLLRNLLIRKKSTGRQRNFMGNLQMDKPRAMMRVTAKNAVRSIPGNPTPNPELVSAP